VCPAPNHAGGGGAGGGEPLDGGAPLRGGPGRSGPGAVCRAALDGLVSASHARAVGVGPADRHAGRDEGGRGVQNTSAVPQEPSPRAAFKARRGLASQGASPSGGGCGGASGGPGPTRPATGWPGRRGVGGTRPSRSSPTISVGKHAVERWLLNHLVTTVVLGRPLLPPEYARDDPAGHSMLCPRLSLLRAARTKDSETRQDPATNLQFSAGQVGRVR
jgi:hypothetical protein